MLLVGEDYIVTNGELEFQPSSDPVACSSGVSIVSDTLLENSETFILSLESMDPSVTLSSTNSEITIEVLDSNSKLHDRAIYI